MRFTVLIPTFDNGPLIRPAIESVLLQTHADFELVVVGDGAPPVVETIVAEYAAADPRVAYRAYPKGERHGEAHRHAALAGRKTDAVAYLSDDDFWLPDHLATLTPLLDRCDFAHTRHLSIGPDLMLIGRAGDLADADTKRRLRAERFNFFGLSVAAHRLDAYRLLPVGWKPAPPDVWTDLNMWRKWLAQSEMRLRTSPAITTVHMARSERRDLPAGYLANETRTWFEAFREPSMVDALRHLCPPDETPFALADVFREARRLRDTAVHAEASPEAPLRRLFAGFRGR